MTLKEEITKKLLDGLREPAGLEEVFRQYRASKGPFYLGLSIATSQAELQLQDLAQALVSQESQRK